LFRRLPKSLPDHSSTRIPPQISGADSCSQIRGSGYVVQSLEAALRAFFHSNTLEEGCLMAVNLGDDADTTGAIYGQIAGAYYGVNAIPTSWRKTLAEHAFIIAFAEKLAYG